MQDIQITIIEPRGKSLALITRELWKYRELLYFLTWRDVKIRYKQTAIGIAWAVLQPVVTTVIFTIIFSRFLGGDTVGVPYPLFVLSGLIIWLFVHTSVSMASTSFVNNTNLVTKVYFPRLIVPLSATFAGLFDLVFALMIMVGLLVYYAVIPTLNLLLVPLFIVMAFVQAAAFGILFASLNVRFRDVKFALPFLLQVWMIASPLFYPVGLVPPAWRSIFAINPLVGIIEGFRACLFGNEFDWSMIAISVVSLLVFTAVSLIVFSHLEDNFADVI